MGETRKAKKRGTVSVFTPSKTSGRAAWGHEGRTPRPRMDQACERLHRGRDSPPLQVSVDGG